MSKSTSANATETTVTPNANVQPTNAEPANVQPTPVPPTAPPVQPTVSLILSDAKKLVTAILTATDLVATKPNTTPKTVVKDPDDSNKVVATPITAERVYDTCRLLSEDGGTDAVVRLQTISDLSATWELFVARKFAANRPLAKASAEKKAAEKANRLSGLAARYAKK